MQKVNYILHLNQAFQRINTDVRLSPYHVSLYYSLFQYWNISKFRNPISISRHDQMQSSKIGSVNTYLKSLKDLHNWGYIKYEPSHNPMKGSLVYLFKFDTTDSTTKYATTHTTAQTTPKQVLRPSTNHLNNSNNTKQQTGTNARTSTASSNNNNHNKIQYNENNNDTQKEKKVAPKKRKPNHGPATVPEKKGKKSNAEESSKNTGHRTKTSYKKRPEKNGENSAAHEGFKRPLLSEVRQYFERSTWPAIEAEKFFNYYQANGWLVGGKTPMQSWQPSAANWIINAANFSNGKDKTAGKLNATSGKDYSEPL